MLQNGNYFEQMLQCPVKNVSGETIPPHSIMAVADVSRVNGVRYCHVEKPSTTVRWRHLLSGPVAIPTSATGIGYYGCVPGKYTTGTPAVGNQYGAKPNSWELFKDYPGGFTVDGIEDSTNKILFGILPPFVPYFYGKAYGAIAKGATSASMKVHSGPPGTGSSEISSMVLTGIYCPWDAIADTKLMAVALMNGYPTAVAKECS